jgi:hypothetical protein
VLCLMSAGLYQEFFECDDDWVISSVKPIEFNQIQGYVFNRVRNPAQVRQSDPLDRRRIFDFPILHYASGLSSEPRKPALEADQSNLLYI